MHIYVNTLDTCGDLWIGSARIKSDDIVRVRTPSGGWMIIFDIIRFFNAVAVVVDIPESVCVSGKGRFEFIIHGKAALK